jgi:cytochrome b6-f complex iron-sulfur subunit
MKKQEASDLTTRPLSRREFLSLAAWAGVLVSGLAALGKGLRFLQPAVTYGPAPVYSVGSPADFPPGSRRLLQRERVLIARDERGLRALSAVCTHLGCTVTLMEWGFSCPCHGSKFDWEGVNFAGPAPRPLPCFQLTLSPEGQLVVDTRRTVPRDQFFDFPTTGRDA